MAAILKIRYYGHHEYINERLHIQKCFFDDSLCVCQIWCFYQKVHNFFGKPLHYIPFFQLRSKVQPCHSFVQADAQLEAIL